MNKNINTATAIMIGDRYFYAISITGRVMTAWSLAGAELFSSDINDLRREQVEKWLILKKKRYSIINIQAKPCPCFIEPEFC